MNEFIELTKKVSGEKFLISRAAIISAGKRGVKIIKTETYVIETVENYEELKKELIK